MSDQEELVLLRAENAAFRISDAKHRAENAELRQAFAALNDKLNLLLLLEGKKTIKKDSHNSSMPPSSDFATPKTQSLRPPSVLKSGGQVGHKGTTLEMTSNPDKVINLKSNFCSRCGTLLSDSSFVLNSKRQVIELPPVIPVFEEYRQYACTCPGCQHKQMPDFPLGVTAPIQYGSSVESLLSYLSVYQYVPFARLQNLFTQVFSLPLSQGTVANILERSADKCAGVYKIIKTKIAESTVVGSDETGAKVNGDKWWIWVWQTVQNTLLVASDNRGSKTIDKVWKDGLPGSILITDRWGAQLKTSTGGQQLCLAHLLRNIIFLDESEKHPFASQFKQLLNDIFTDRKKLIGTKKPYTQNQDEAKKLETRLNDLLLIVLDKEKYPHTLTFQESMIKNRAAILPCLYNLEIPPDNNGSERAIRNVKVKQKVSGQFKSGQDAFCIIRSVIDTLRKRNVEVLPCLTKILNLQPE